jgi:hypothetical protein
MQPSRKLSNLSSSYGSALLSEQVAQIKTSPSKANADAQRMSMQMLLTAPSGVRAFPIPHLA